jgi:hypothetical protein
MKTGSPEVIDITMIIRVTLAFPIVTVNVQAGGVGPMHNLPERLC